MVHSGSLGRRVHRHHRRVHCGCLGRRVARGHWRVHHQNRGGCCNRGGCWCWQWGVLACPWGRRGHLGRRGHSRGWDRGMVSPVKAWHCHWQWHCRWACGSEGISTSPSASSAACRVRSTTAPASLAFSLAFPPSHWGADLVREIRRFFFALKGQVPVDVFSWHLPKDRATEAGRCVLALWPCLHPLGRSPALSDCVGPVG